MKHMKEDNPCTFTPETNNKKLTKVRSSDQFYQDQMNYSHKVLAKTLWLKQEIEQHEAEELDKSKIKRNIALSKSNDNSWSLLFTPRWESDKWDASKTNVKEEDMSFISKKSI